MGYKRILALSAVFMVSAVATAQAHVGADGGAGHSAGFSVGYVHPIGGLDHILAMVAVGVLAFQQGGRALWLIPLSFVAMMLVGAGLAMAGLDVAFVELGILGSVIVLGAVVAMGRSMSLPLAMAMVGGLSVFHGMAHGTEMPANTSALTYGLGFVAATAMLHIAGIASSRAVQKSFHRVAPSVVRIVGGVTATIGMAMLAAS